MKNKLIALGMTMVIALGLFFTNIPLLSNATEETAGPTMLIDGKTPEEFYEPYKDVLGVEPSYGELVTGSYIDNYSVTDEQLKELEDKGAETYNNKIPTGTGFREVGTSSNPNASYPKITLDGDVAYCLNFEKDVPVNVQYKQGTPTTTKNYSTEGLACLLYHGYPSNATGLKEKYGLSNDKAREETQRAIWLLTSNTKGLVAAAQGYAKELMNLANAKKYPWSEIKVEGGTTLKFTDKGSYKQSQLLTTKGGPGTFKLETTNGAYLVNEKGEKKSSLSIGSKFYVRTPYSTKGTVTAKVVGSYKAKTVSWWIPKNGGNAQHLARVGDDPRQGTVSLAGRISTPGQIEVKKTDDNGKNLQGAQIKLKKGSKTTETKTTNASGNVTFTGLENGTWEIIEVKAPSGYQLKTNLGTAKAEADKLTKVTVKNSKIKGKVQVVKKDDEGNKLGGAEFAIYKDGKEIKKAVSKDDGTAVFTDLDAGSYTIKETKAPAGYVKSEGTNHAKIEKHNQSITVNFTNKIIKGSVKITKTDSVTKQPLKGVEFGLYNSANKKIASATTDAKGIATFTNVKYGKYTVKETKALDGYLLDGDPMSAEIKTNGQTVSLTMTNRPIQNGIRITKVDAETKDPVQGATIALMQGGKVVESKVTNANGIVYFNKLKQGKYSVKETKAPTGYKLNSKAVDVDATDPNKVYNVTITNEAIKAPIVINKTDVDTKLPIKDVVYGIYQNNTLVQKVTTNAQGKAQSNDLLVGKYTVKELEAPAKYVVDTTVKNAEIKEDGKAVTLNLTNKVKVANVSFSKTDTATKKPVVGATYSITGNGINKTLTTDKLGAGKINLPYGDYTIKEVKAPAGYVLDTKPYTLEVRENGAMTFKHTNDQIKGSIVINKTDSVTGAKLQGAVFEVQDAKGTKVATLTTNKNGQATTGELPYGKYTVVETKAPTNYKLDSTKRAANITTDGQKVTLNIKNTEMKGSIKVIKTDGETIFPVEGAVFEVYNSAKKVVAKITTNAKGEAVTPALSLGKYTLKEVGSPKEYTLNTKTFSAEILKPDEEVKVNVSNAPVKGTITVSKVDKENAKLPVAGAEYTIYSDAKCTKPIETLVTNAKGLATSKELRYGTYYIKETKSPDNYWLDDTVYKANVVTDGQNYTVNTKDELRKSKISILKRDEETGELLRGVTFRISSKTNPDFKPIEISTTETGIAETDLLDYGTYIVEEVKAPIIYFLAEPIEVVVDGNQASIGKPLEPDIIEVPVFNTRKQATVNLVKTVDESTSELVYSELKAGDPMEGVEFKLFYAPCEDEFVTEEDLADMLTDMESRADELEWQEIGTYVTDEKGNIAVDGLEIGLYKFVETVPNEFKPVEDKIFSIAEDKQEVSIEVTNEYKTAIFEMYKTDNQGNPIEGVVFDILDSNQKLIKTCTTDKNGRFDIELPLGNYFYKEVSVPNVEEGHYIFSEEPVAFEITEDATVIKAEVVNELIITPKTASMSNMAPSIVAGLGASTSLLAYALFRRRRNK